MSLPTKVVGDDISSKSADSAPLLTTTTATTTNGSDPLQASLDCLGDLIKLLPTGTVFLFHFVNPILTSKGACDPLNRALSIIFIIVLALFCFFITFTDSYTDAQGKIVYGVATPSGFWTPGFAAEASSMTAAGLASFRLQFSDFVHALFSLLVFLMVVLLDDSTVRCFYPSLATEQRVLMIVLPPVIGTVASSVFVMFPINRHWIGYPASVTPPATSVATAIDSA